MVLKITNGEVAADADPKKEHRRKGGTAGGAARAAKLAPMERSAIAKKAAARWWNRA
jgi:hypothetical protein